MKFIQFYLKENEENFDLDTLNQFQSFAKRVNYTKSKLKKLGEGSSRVVFEYDDKSVLKLAKNPKGVAQNDHDGDYGKHRMYPNLVPEVIDRDGEGIWVIVRKANKITPTKFKDLTKISFQDFCKMVRELELHREGKVKKLNPETQKLIDDDSGNIVYDIYDMMGSFDMLSGDICKISSWGEINNKAVLLDTGFTQDVYKTHYRK